MKTNRSKHCFLSTVSLYCSNSQTDVSKKYPRGLQWNIQFLSYTLTLKAPHHKSSLKNKSLSYSEKQEFPGITYPSKKRLSSSIEEQTNCSPRLFQTSTRIQPVYKVWKSPLFTPTAPLISCVYKLLYFSIFKYLSTSAIAGTTLPPQYKSQWSHYCVYIASRKIYTFPLLARN